MPVLGMVTMDTADARGLAAWWAERLGGEIAFDADGYFCSVVVPGWQTKLGFQLVEDPTPGKNRLHLDLDVPPGTDREATLAEWTAAGATHLGEFTEGRMSWDVFADPDGNQFCVGGAH